MMNQEIARQGYFLHCMDPGGDTGLGLLHVRPGEMELIDWATIRYDPRSREPGSMPTATLIDWVLEYPGRHELVYEDFHVRNNSSDKDTTALRVIGSVDQVLYDRDLFEAVHAQEPVAAKHMVSDEVLEKLGLHMAHAHSQRHVRDSLRHGVSHLARRRYLPVCRAAYPKGGGIRGLPRPGSRL